MKTLTEWVNLPEEDKYGKFMLLGYMSEEEFDGLAESMPIVGTNHFSMIPLEVLDAIQSPGIYEYEDYFMTVVDAEFIRTLRGVAVVNQEDFARFK